jgi:hypothetical protein
MGTKKTAQIRISRLRETFRKCRETGKSISKKKLIAEIVLTGSTQRYAREIVQTFIDAEEIIEIEENGEKIIKPNEAFYDV